MSTAMTIRPGSGIQVPTSKKKLLSGFLSSKKALATAKYKAKETVEQVVRSTEIAGAAFALGGIQGMRAGEGKEPLKIMGKVNLELAVAGGLHLLGLLGVAGEYSSHLKNFGDGALAAFASNWGRGIGYKWARENQSSGTTSGGIEDRINDFLP